MKLDTAVITKGIKDGSIPEGIRYLDENILMMDGGIPIIIEGKVVVELSLVALMEVRMFALLRPI